VERDIRLNNSIWPEARFDFSASVSELYVKSPEQFIRIGRKSVRIGSPYRLALQCGTVQIFE